MPIMIYSDHDDFTSRKLISPLAGGTGIWPSRSLYRRDALLAAEDRELKTPFS